jgi:hypothetical protein
MVRTTPFLSCPSTSRSSIPLRGNSRVLESCGRCAGPALCSYSQRQPGRPSTNTPQRGVVAVSPLGQGRSGGRRLRRTIIEGPDKLLGRHTPDKERTRLFSLGWGPQTPVPRTPPAARGVGEGVWGGGISWPIVQNGGSNTKSSRLDVEMDSAPV